MKETLTLKRCSKCHGSKERTEFNRCAGNADGLQAQCRECQREGDRARAIADPERVRERQRRYRARHPEKMREINRRQGLRRRQTDAKKIKARKDVQYAVKTGRLVKADACEDCGEFFEDTRKLHGHHEDYSKPLEVEWLCLVCHMRRHHGD